MEQKIEFICEWRTGKYTITELYKCFDISRPTAYKIISRFENKGYEGLRELSRKPRRPHPNSTNEKVVERILFLKEKHKLWGAKKLHTLLYKDFHQEIISTVLTVHNILKKHGLVSPQKRLRRVKPIHPIFDPKHCNEVWNADYKGKFLMGNKSITIPLQLQTQRADLYLPQKDIIKKTLTLQKANSKGFLGNSGFLNKSILTMEAHLVPWPL
ncbi:helix-turn-helix domain-containing protein [uncultured Maribacter sp.]|uniref:helix-turn-helix domain-containing protein n=1 Tax=uncultured Maribacter sp. TaxID=431308 RepID=UPI00262441F7|nr:helix-turn-helix domain-containing protein [uncultured Maribacter sp.]